MSRRCDRVKTIFMGRPKESGDITGSPWFWENTGSTPFWDNTGSPSFWDHSRSPNYSNNTGSLRSLDISRSPLFQNLAKLCLVFCLLVNRDVSARHQDCASCVGVPCQKITGGYGSNGKMYKVFRHRHVETLFVQGRYLVPSRRAIDWWNSANQ